MRKITIRYNKKKAEFLGSMFVGAAFAAMLVSLLAAM